MHAKTAKHHVALVVYDGVALFEFGVASEVFGAARGQELGVPWYDLTVCGPRASVLTDGGFRMQVLRRLDALEAADTVVVLPTEHYDRVPPTVLRSLRAAHARGVRLMSLCTGAFVLAAAGLLDGRRATTHWSECDALARAHPAVEIDPSVLYVDGGDILTSAGSAAGIDLCLHVVARDRGVEVANRLARQLVVTPQRPGGQAQYIETPLPAREGADLFVETLAWAQAHLNRRLSVGEMAARSAMSPRTFARRFRATTGATPYRWLLAQRLTRAQRLLETTSLAVEQVARDSGFPDATAFRKAFNLRFHTTPSAYRAAFQRSVPSA